MKTYLLYKHISKLRIILKKKTVITWQALGLLLSQSKQSGPCSVSRFCTNTTYIYKRTPHIYVSTGYMRHAVHFSQFRYLLYKQQLTQNDKHKFSIYLTYSSKFKSELTANPFKILKPQQTIRFLDFGIIFSCL